MDAQVFGWFDGSVDDFNSDTYFDYVLWYSKTDCITESELECIKLKYTGDNYRFSLYTINCKDGELKYFVVQEMLTTSEIEKLLQYCDCMNCKSWVKVQCSCCIGCIRSGDFVPVSKNRIENARRQYELYGDKPKSTCTIL